MKIKTAKKYQVVSVGGATRDIIFYSKEGELVATSNLTKQKLLAFEYGAKIMADKIYFTYGGGAANSSTAFSLLGLKSAIVARIGDDENGQKILKNLAGRKVDTGLIKKDAKAATGFSIILALDNAAKEHIAFLHRGANTMLSAHDLPDLKILADWFYVTSLPKNNWEGIMARLTGSGKNISWNPGGQQLKELNKLKKFLPKITVFMVNRDEAMEFKKLKDIKGLLKYIFGLGPKIAVITDGDNGAYVFDGQKYYYMKAKSNKAVNTVGVGDAFGSGFTAALIFGKSIKEALKWGINNSASVVSKIGSQEGLLNRRQITR